MSLWGAFFGLYGGLFCPLWWAFLPIMVGFFANYEGLFWGFFAFYGGFFANFCEGFFAEIWLAFNGNFRGFVLLREREGEALRNAFGSPLPCLCFSNSFRVCAACISPRFFVRLFANSGHYCDYYDLFLLLLWIILSFLLILFLSIILISTNHIIIFMFILSCSWGCYC